MSDPELLWLDPGVLMPNGYNPNRMDDEMYAKAIASIRAFGFIDPITVREVGLTYEIVDGEHRWMAAKDEGLNPVPVITLGELDDDTAKQLTIVLNETRGSADPRKLAALLKDLSSRNSVTDLLATLPYSKDLFDRLIGASKIDWSELEAPIRPASGKLGGWVERTYRMPVDSAEVIDRAIARFRETEGDGIPEWKVIELLSADYLGA